MKKIYLIDGMSLVFRAYHAMSQAELKSPEGLPTGAVFGFTNMITSLMEKEKPEYFAVVFDTHVPTFRHIQYPAYKANRAAFPEELIPQMPLIKELLDLLSIPRFEKDGFEADDVIGTIAKIASGEDHDVMCVTSDKDYYQLVDNHIKLYKPGKRGEDFELVDFQQVEEKFGVTPDKVIDILGLIGDAVDNVPGVKGIGEKTAIPLIQEYGTIEGLYENIDKISRNAVKTKLIDNKDNALLSKDLVTIKIDVELDIKIEDCKNKTPDYEKLDEFFKKVGFNTIRLRWKEKALKENNKLLFPTGDRKEENATPEVNQLKDIVLKYQQIKSIDELKSYINEIKPRQRLAFDLETDSLDRNACEIVGISLSYKEGSACYIPVEYFNKNSGEIFNSSLFDKPQFSNERKWKDSLDVDEVIEIIKPALENENIEKCGQNAKFDMYILKRHGIEVSPISFDSMVASYIIDPDQKHNLDALSRKWLNYQPIPITKLIGEKKSTQITMRDIAPVEIVDYASEDADLALKLSNKLEEVLVDEKLIDLAKNIEFPLIKVLTQMEFDGVAIDTNALKDISIHIDIETKRLTEEIFNEAGTNFNIDSPKQLAEVLFEKMQINPTKKNKTGFSTDVQVLTELAYSYPIAGKIVEYRQLQKLKSTYVDALPKLINPRTGRIHTTYNQTVASTGRLSSTDPNLQNIPIRTDLGKEIRKAFVPQFDDFVIFSADYSQIELRIMAFMCNDASMINSFKNGLDIHAATAAILFNKQLDEVDSDMRRIAKTVNFGIMYGLGSFGLSQRLGNFKKRIKRDN